MRFLKKTIFSFLLSLMPLALQATDPLKVPAEEVTFEYLADNVWTNHVIFFKKIFQTTQPGTFLEFGMGNATKFFLDNSVKVVSVELNADCTVYQTEPWFYGCRDKFAPLYSNWTPILHQCSKQLSDLTERAWSGKAISPPRTFLEEIKAICDFSLKLCKHDCSIAFVDSALFGRGYIVKELLRRHVPIVAAHDTDLGVNFYRWDEITTPAEYTRLDFKNEDTNQLTLWIMDGTLTDSELADLRG